ncbi:MAG: multi-sensor hybrid histidine kinase, partial [Pedosphaera sp.]|nr:multi-sensor hybrid histidine kinase [Pedosphaera sp.]
LLDKAQDAICLNDLAHQILYWNKSAERLYGWSASEALGKNANDLLFHGDLTGSGEAFKSLIRMGEWHGDLRQVTKTGRKIIVESRWTLMRDDRGESKSVLIINTDVTEKKQLEMQFLRTQRVESIGALAGGIAHDLNNALAPVLIGTDLLRETLAGRPEEQLLDTMKASIGRGADMIRQILSFSRGVEGQHVPLQLKPLVTELVNFAKETFPRSITVLTEIADGLHTVVGNSTQLHQVLLNLCVNGRDAMPQGGSLIIGVKNITLDATCLPKDRSLMPGAYVLIKVSDTGHGIAPELLAKIFEPFFTTKELGQGTGLGLSTVMGIVKTHNGFLEVSSQVGSGTTFEVYLPAKITRETLAPRGNKPIVPMGQGEELLVVDDEIALLELTKLTLESYNYRVLAATGGAEALTFYQQNRGSIKAVLTDMMMPGMNGAELMQALRRMDSSVKILGMSGHASELVLKLAGYQEANVFLKKPFTTEELLKTIRRVIETD